MILAEGQFLLFHHEGELRALFEAQYLGLQKEIYKFDKNYLLNANEIELKEYLEKKYQITHISIDREAITVNEPSEKYVNNVRGYGVSINVPFSGESNIFLLRPLTSTCKFPKGSIRGNEIILIYSTTIADPDKLKEEYSQDLSLIDQYISWANKDINDFNKTLKAMITNHITLRKNKLKKANELVRGLGIKLKKRENIPETFNIPEIKRKPKITSVRPSLLQKEQEPILEIQEYEYILTILFNMAATMERSPRTFSRLDEEEIRDHFLMHLNGHYDGLATGETFNCEGKTDILIRYKGKNIFIAECKIWRGKRYFEDAIDQLLSYTSWRDTKTAILIFNKNKNFSQVLSQIEPCVNSHANFLNKRKLNENILSNESIFANDFCHKDDKQRELILTTMAFDIPEG